MSKYISRLEDLPNELLNDIFKILNARDLFRSFYNLNYRLNQILKSFQHLQLIYHINSSNISKINNEIYSYYVYTLIIDPWITLNLKYFQNLHRLKLNNPLPKLLEEIKGDIIPYIEDLSIFYTYNMYEMNLVHKRIFSNDFHYLKSCEILYDKQTLITIPDHTQSPSIHILKIQFINLSIYKLILVSCPNLYYFKFGLYSSNDISTSTNIQLHHKLKHIVIEFYESEWFNDDNILSDYLSCVPNVEYIEIHRKNYSENLFEYLENYDWLQSIITYRLPLLKKIKFYIHLSNNEKLIPNMNKNKLIQIQNDFINVYKGQYNAQLIIDRELMDII